MIWWTTCFQTLLKPEPFEGEKNHLYYILTTVFFTFTFFTSLKERSLYENVIQVGSKWVKKTDNNMKIHLNFFFSSRNNMKRILSYQNKFKPNPLSKVELDKNVYYVPNLCTKNVYVCILEEAGPRYILFVHLLSKHDYWSQLPCTWFRPYLQSLHILFRKFTTFIRVRLAFFSGSRPFNW